MKNTLVGHNFIVRNRSGVPSFFQCFAYSFREDSFYGNQPETEVLFRNRGPEFGLSIEQCQEFVDILQDAVSKVKGAQLKFRVEFDNANQDMLDDFKYYGRSDQRGNYMPYEKDMNTLTYYVDTTVTGNKAWFWLGAILRNFQNSPRTIISFLRLAHMKWGDKTLLEHWGFLHTFNLAHIIRLEPKEKGFNVAFYENYIMMNIGGFKYANTIENYLLNNVLLPKANNYTTGSDGVRRMLFDNHAPRPRLGDENGFGVYWDDTMPQSIINDLFEGLPEEKVQCV